MKFNIIHKLFFIALITVFGIYLFPSTVSALSLSPVRFELSGDRGQTVENEFLIINENDSAETFYFSFANFEAQGESGTPAFVDPKEGLGTWIKTESSSVGVGPKEQKTVPFKIQIPEDAEPGGHFAVILLGNSPAGGDNTVSIGSQTGILVLLSVNGDVKEDAGLLDFKTVDKQFLYKTLPVSFEYRFRNDGGDRVKPEGDIIIRNTFFIKSDVLDANKVEGNILPSSTRKFKVDWLKYERPIDSILTEGMFNKFWDNVTYEWKNFALGLYSANLNIEYGTKQEIANKTVFFFVFPWELFIVMILILITSLLIIKFAISRYNNHIIQKARESFKNEGR